MKRRKFQQIIREEVKKVLNEGSWKLPLTVQAAKDLDRAVRRKGVVITAQEVRDLPIGTDTLWNSLEDGGDPYYSLYVAIKDFINTPNSRFSRKTPDPQAKEILRGTIQHMKKYLF